MAETSTERTFPTPSAPYPNVLAYHHEHQLTLDEDRVLQNPNGTHSSLWTCSQCPDVFIGDHIGPIPAGYCDCGWVQKRWPREACEECGGRFRGVVDQGIVEDDVELSRG